MMPLLIWLTSGDLLFQTAAVKLFMPKARRRRYADFTYRHHSIIGGKVAFGGIEAGWRDRDARATLKAYASTYEGVGNGTGVTSDLRVRKCGVQEEVDGPFRPTLYISPALDAAEAHHVSPGVSGDKIPCVERSRRVNGGAPLRRR